MTNLQKLLAGTGVIVIAAAAYMLGSHNVHNPFHLVSHATDDSLRIRDSIRNAEWDSAYNAAVQNAVSRFQADSIILSFPVVIDQDDPYHGLKGAYAVRDGYLTGTVNIASRSDQTLAQAMGYTDGSNIRVPMELVKVQVGYSYTLVDYPPIWEIKNSKGQTARVFAYQAPQDSLLAKTARQIRGSRLTLRIPYNKIMRLYDNDPTDY